MDPDLQYQHGSRQSTARLSSQPSASTPAAEGSEPCAHEADASSEDSKASKRMRTSRPKVKTGCACCKDRRIKCDEIRPSCTQCVRSKKVCKGYPPPSRYEPNHEIAIAPKPGLAPFAAAAPNASLAPALRQQQQPLYPGGPNAQPRRPYLKHQQSAQLPPRQANKLAQRRNNQSGTAHAATALVARPAAVSFTFTYHPSNGLPFSTQEGLYYDLFRSQTANELSGFFDNVFWSRSVLAECHNEAAIRHAVVALGALYKTLEKTTESPPTSPSGRPCEPDRNGVYRHWEVALTQYSRALAALAALVAEDGHTKRILLMGSVLITCFDSFVGAHKEAITHIQAGLRLLDRVRTDHRQSRGSSSSSEPVEDELTQMFARLAIQAKSYDMAFHFPQPYVIRLLPEGAAQAVAPSSAPLQSDVSSPAAPPETASIGSPVSMHQDSIPAQFTSLRQARLSWDALCELIFRSMELMFQSANGPPNLLPARLASYGGGFQQRIGAWSDAFEPLLRNRANPGVSSQEKAGIAVLKMFQIMALILCLMTFVSSEMVFDEFRPYFKAIVDLANEVVGDEERRAEAARCPDAAQCTHRYHHSHGAHAPGADYADYADDYRSGFKRLPGHIKASFSADLGIVPPLFVVATKSRDRVLRRQAIQLLRSSARREGMWDSELVARIAMWVVGIEEEGEEEEFVKSLYEHRTSAAGASYDRLGSVGSVESDQTLRAIDVANLPSPASSMSSPQTLPLYTSMPSGSPDGSSGTPSPSPHTHLSVPNTSSGNSQAATSSPGSGDTPLGPGGNARWDEKRTVQAWHTKSVHQPAVSGPVNSALPYYMQISRPVSSEKRILIKSCEFDLREHTATLTCGTRGLASGHHDMKTRQTKIRW